MLTLEFKEEKQRGSLSVMSSDESFNDFYNVCFWDYKKNTEKFKFIDTETLHNTFNVYFKKHKLERYNNPFVKDEENKFKDYFLFYSLDGKRCKLIDINRVTYDYLDYYSSLLN